MKKKIASWLRKLSDKLDPLEQWEIGHSNLPTYSDVNDSGFTLTTNGTTATGTTLVGSVIWFDSKDKK